ncbi:MAG: hypothetical protein ICV62_07885 [Cyanobacteria bacterium Co-bin13]|nr:hypothetical protein [Cyanobacteria bacterium Co-bin13]
MALAVSYLLSLGGIRFQAQEAVSFTIQDEPVAQIDDRLFGHFLERASWGEPGPEVSLEPGTQQIQPAAVELMRQMNIPLLRFPGGTDVDYIDWRDLISNVPGRDPKRPVTIGYSGKKITNQFGLDEYFQLRDQLGTETILVVNFLDALSRRLPLEEAALRVAGLVAYANAPAGAALPEGMPDWPAVRRENGHAEPYRVEYIQIGNETWLEGFRRRVREGTGLSEPVDLAQWYLQCLKAYIQAIDAVDPSVELIIDGTMGQGVERTVLADAAIRNRVKYVAFHSYAPGHVREVKQDGEPVASRAMAAIDWWNAWVAMPGHFSESGVNQAVANHTQFAQSLGYQIAVTEWNWNGWGFDELEPPPAIDWPLASGLGAAGFLNGMMRHGDEIAIACQSMLVGASWDITSIRVDPTAQTPPYFLPQGQITQFYSKHHGSSLLSVESLEVPRYRQPFDMGWARSPEAEIALIDLVATADEDTVYVHIINRSFDRDLRVALDLSDFSAIGNAVTHHLFSERRPAPPDSQRLSVGEITAKPLSTQGQSLQVMLPKRSVSILEIPRA